MSRATISLLMPNYNHGEYLSDSVGALLCQTRSADEIIIIDDKSSDNSRDILAQLTAGRNTVTVHHNSTRLGALKTLNLALHRATSDYVAFPSADDVLDPHFLEVSEPLLTQHPQAAFCCARVDVADRERTIIGRRPVIMPTMVPRYVPPAEFRRALATGDHYFLGAVTLYRRQQLLDLGGFDEELGAASDGVMQLRLAGRHGFCFVPRILGVWRVHGNNYSATSATNPQTLDAVLDKSKATIANEPADILPPNYAALFERRLRFSAARILVLQDNPAPDASLRLADISQIGRNKAPILNYLLRLGSLRKPLLVLWLALRFRPFSFTWLSVEPLRRLYANARASSH